MPKREKKTCMQRAHVPTETSTLHASLAGWVSLLLLLLLLLEEKRNFVVRGVKARGDDGGGGMMTKDNHPPPGIENHQVS